MRHILEKGALGKRHKQMLNKAVMLVIFALNGESKGEFIASRRRDIKLPN